MESNHGPWAEKLAAAVVARGPLPPAAAEGLRAAFQDVCTVILAMATGEGDLEAVHLLRGGLPCTSYVSPTPLSPGACSTALWAIQQPQEVLYIDLRTSERDQLADWQQLQQQEGIDWLLAAPLGCSGSGSEPQQQRQLRQRPDQQHYMLGAVLVGGRGPVSTIDGEWLREWALEMGDLISHASVQLMECSLEMLGAMFPPRILEQLVMNAASRTGQADLATALREALSHPGGDGGGGDSLSPATCPSSARSSSEGRPPRPARLPDGIPHRQLCIVQAHSGSPTTASPFAAAPAAPLFTSTPPSPVNAADVDMCPTPQLNGVLSTSAAGLLRQASRSSTASAFLHQVSLQSLQSDMSRFFEDDLPSSPHNWELEGYEDILEEDHRVTLERRPSMALDRAHSNHARTATSTPDQTIAAAEVDMETAGGLQAAVQQATAHVSVEEAAATAAARPPSPAAEPVKALPSVSVRVPWVSKPLFNPMTSSDQEAEAFPLLSPRKPVALPKPLGAGSGSKTGGSCLGCSEAAMYEKPAAAGSGSSCKAARCSGASTAAATIPAAAQHAWNLSFATPALEARYRNWLLPYLLRSDTSLGIVHWILAASALVKMALRGTTMSSLLSPVGVLLMAVPSLPSSFSPAWWGARRTAFMSALRLLSTALFAAHLVVAAAAWDVTGHNQLSWVEVVLGHSGAAALCLLPLRLPLPFSMHLPLHLLCLWIVTAGASLAHMRRPGAAPPAAGAALLSLPTAMLAQLAVGFVLSTFLVYRHEERLRTCFLRSRHAAACLGSPERRCKWLPPAATPPKA